MNNVITTGLRVKPHSSIVAVAGPCPAGEPSHGVTDPTKKQVASFFLSKGIKLDCYTVEACHPLPRGDDSDKPAIIMRFSNWKHKSALLKQGRFLKGSDVFINEHLTKKNADIARNQKKIQSTWTTNCKVVVHVDWINIKLNGMPEEAKVLVVWYITELDKYD